MKKITYGYATINSLLIILSLFSLSLGSLLSSLLLIIIIIIIIIIVIIIIIITWVTKLYSLL